MGGPLGEAGLSRAPTKRNGKKKKPVGQNKCGSGKGNPKSWEGRKKLQLGENQ